jgi:hypothetical protein
MAYNTIKLKKYSDVIVEFAAGGTILPGHLLLLGSGNTVTAGPGAAAANLNPMFALEDELQGKGIDSAYISGDKVQCWIPGRGDVVNAVLKDGAIIVIGDFLEAGANGLLQKYTSGKAVAQALEALDLSGGSNSNLPQNEYDSVLGYNRRLKVQII